MFHVEHTMNDDSTMKIRPATADDLAAIDSLRKKYGSDLGFLPLQKYQHIVNKTLDRGRSRWKYERLYVVEDNDDMTGFVLGSLGRNGAKCEQVCVREDARRMERAMRLVDAIQAEAIIRHLPLIRCRVAADIEANLFWQAIGYTAIDTTTSTWLNIKESKSKRPIILYEKPLGMKLF